jgi:hypothetical protein
LTVREVGNGSCNSVFIVPLIDGELLNSLNESNSKCCRWFIGEWVGIGKIEILIIDDILTIKIILK